MLPKKHEFKHLHVSHFIIVVNPVIIYFKMVKFVIIYSFYCPYAFFYCHCLKYVWTEMGFGKELWIIMVWNDFRPNCPVLIADNIIFVNIQVLWFWPSLLWKKLQFNLYLIIESSLCFQVVLNCIYTNYTEWSHYGVIF